MSGSVFFEDKQENREKQYDRAAVYRRKHPVQYKLKGQNTGTDYSYKLIDEPCYVTITKQGSSEQVDEIIDRGLYWITVRYNGLATNKDFGSPEFIFRIKII